MNLNSPDKASGFLRGQNGSVASNYGLLKLISYGFLCRLNGNFAAWNNVLSHSIFGSCSIMVQMSTR